MTEKDFRTSERHREALRTFLQSESGRAFAHILHQKCLPIPMSVAGKMSSEDQIRAMGLVMIHQQGAMTGYQTVMRLAEPLEDSSGEVDEDFRYLIEPMEAHYADLKKRMESQK